MTIAHRDATPADLGAIDRIFRASFVATFGHLYAAADLEAFLAQFTPEAWAEEMAGVDYAFRLAEDDGRAAGFLKLGPLTVPVEPAQRALELRQLYVLEPWHGSGIAAALMEWALGEAERREARELYLTVYTDNHRAKRFYQRYGFVAVGRYDFMVGSQADEDIIMKRLL
jgi:GNAT superfamily N-acetyltransferase